MYEGERGPDLELESVAAFRTQLRRFLRRTDIVTSQAGLTTQRYDLLLMLKSADREGRGVCLTDLRQLLQLQQTAVTELVSGPSRRVPTTGVRPPRTVARRSSG